jgi:4'-phosphopantetheinyl transferase
MNDPVSATVWFLDESRISEKSDRYFIRLLSASERQRYNRFSRPHRQRQFLFGRLLLRFAVSTTFGMPIDGLVVEERPGNAPILLNSDFRNFSFSLSHARQWIACAIGVGCRIGVDIEANDPARDIQSISEMVFHPEDRRWLADQQKKDYLLAFYRLWCTREAVFKLFPYARETGCPLVKPLGWYSYSSVKPGFTIVLCSSRPLKAVQQVSVVRSSHVTDCGKRPTNLRT